MRNHLRSALGPRQDLDRSLPAQDCDEEEPQDDHLYNPGAHMAPIPCLLLSDDVPVLATQPLLGASLPAAGYLRGPGCHSRCHHRPQCHQRNMRLRPGSATYSDDVGGTAQ